MHFQGIWDLLQFFLNQEAIREKPTAISHLHVPGPMPQTLLFLGMLQTGRMIPAQPQGEDCCFSGVLRTEGTGSELPLKQQVQHGQFEKHFSLTSLSCTLKKISERSSSAFLQMPLDVFFSLCSPLPVMDETKQFRENYFSN